MGTNSQKDILRKLMKIESMADVKFLAELLFNGRDSFYPREEIIHATEGRVLDFVKQLAELDPANTLVYLEKTGTHHVDEPLYTLWRISAWETRERRKENLHNEVVATHHKQQVMQAKIAMISTKVRRVLKVGPMERSDFCNMLASQALLTNNKLLLTSLGISEEELNELWDIDIENPEEYL